MADHECRQVSRIETLQAMAIENKTERAFIMQGIEKLEKQLSALNEKLDQQYVKEKDFEPVKRRVETMTVQLATASGLGAGIVFAMEKIFSLLK